MAEGLARDGRKVLILAHSKAAISAVKRAGKKRPDPDTCRRLLTRLRRLKREGGSQLGWVKAHMGFVGNDAADVLAKNAAEGTTR